MSGKDTTPPMFLINHQSALTPSTRRAGAFATPAKRETCSPAMNQIGSVVSSFRDRGSNITAQRFAD
jgi:hypothetical protein